MTKSHSSTIFFHCQLFSTHQVYTPHSCCFFPPPKGVHHFLPFIFQKSRKEENTHEISCDCLSTRFYKSFLTHPWEMFTTPVVDPFPHSVFDEAEICLFIPSNHWWYPCYFSMTKPYGTPNYEMMRFLMSEVVLALNMIFNFWRSILWPRVFSIYTKDGFKNNVLLFAALHYKKQLSINKTCERTRTPLYTLIPCNSPLFLGFLRNEERHSMQIIKR